jgi:uncharacterized membrane protein YphA (DoxX/SURF4 family)
MTTEPQAVRRPLRQAGRLVVRALLTTVGIVGALFIYFVCQGMFAGYPRYHTDLLSIVALILTAVTGGVAWMIDERRTDADR